MTDVLLATSGDFPDGEPGAEHLAAALAARSLAHRWARWDDPDVDWGSAPLVAVRSTWDYHARLDDFLAWARTLGRSLLNGADVFAWNADKAYLLELDVPVVPTRLVSSTADVEAALEQWRSVVVKPRVGAGGGGLFLASYGDQVPSLDEAMIAQPLVESIRTEGETSVFVLGSVVSEQVVRKVPAAGEVRAHEQRGATCVPVPLTGELAEIARATVDEAVRRFGAIDYARVDLLRVDDRWAVGELELIEPGLYLDVVPANAEPFADLVAGRLG